jgi:hypothetical protein
MANKPAFAEIIVARLGQPKEPFGLGDLILLIIMAAALAAYLALEQGFGRLLARLFGRVAARIRPDETSPPEA